MLSSAEQTGNRAAARTKLEAELASGRPLEKFREMVRAQGGDAEAELELAPSCEVAAPRSGYVSAIDCESLGYALIALGGGRRSLDDVVDPTVGLQLRVRLGDQVDEGQPLLDLLSAGRGHEEAAVLVEGAFSLTEEPPIELPRLIAAEG